MRVCVALLVCALLPCLAQTPKSEAIRGKLSQHNGEPPALETDGHKMIRLDGDDATRGVINDKRLAGVEMEARGHFTAPDKFQIDPIHTKAILVRRDGHLKLVTYWCDVCSIRTYSPGPCWCCQRETTLDLRDPDEK
jgi:hypothetical protein